MKWTPGSGNSGDVEDQRGRMPSGRAPRVGAAGGGVGVVVIIIYLLVSALGGGGSGGGPAFNIPDSGGFGSSVQAGENDSGSAGAEDPLPASKDPDKNVRDFSAFVVGDVQDTWTQIFADSGKQYRRAK